MGHDSLRFPNRLRISKQSPKALGLNIQASTSGVQALVLDDFGLCVVGGAGFGVWGLRFTVRGLGFSFSVARDSADEECALARNLNPC